MPIAEYGALLSSIAAMNFNSPQRKCGALLPRNVAVSINSPQRNLGSPLSASMHRTIAAGVLPTRSDMPICCGVLVLAYSSDTPV